MVVEFVRSCYQSQWALLPDHPGVYVHGRYVRATWDTPTYPGWTYLCSRDWSAGEQDIFNGLGEVRDAKHIYDYGRPPDNMPLARATGRTNCIGEGERNLPWPVIHEIDAQGDGLVIVTGSIPSIRLDFPEPAGHCDGLLAENGDGLLAENGDGLLAECQECDGLLAENGDGLLAENGDGLLAECMND